MKSVVVAALVIAAVSSPIFAQRQDTSFLRWQLNNIIEEKLRIEPHELREFLRDPKAFRIKQQAESESQAIKVGTSPTPQAITDKLVTGSTNESEVHAAINPTDTANIVCSANGLSSTNSTNAIYYTKDFGATWQKSSFLASPRGGGTILGGGDPMFAFDATGKAYFSWINLFFDQSSNVNMHMYWAQSTNKGMTWQRDNTDDLVAGGTFSFSNPNDPNAVTADKQWMMCDLSNSQYKNTLYCSLLLGLGGDNRSATKFKRATDNQFSTSVLRPTKAQDAHFFQQFNSIDVDELGNVHSTYTAAETEEDFTNGKLIIQHLLSTDGGKSWERETTAQRITFLRGDANSQVNSPEAPTGISRVNILPQIACDKYATSSFKGNVYLVWTALGTDTRLDNGLDVYFSRSTDKGVTWSEPKIINDDMKGMKRTQAYITIGVNEDGVIALCWYDRRNDANDLRGDYYIALSYDGGVTFKLNARVSTVSTDFSRFTGNRAFGVGEYNQVVMTKNFALPFWGDGRSGTRTQIYMGYVPLDKNSTSSVERIANVNGDCNLTKISPNPAPNTTTVSFTLREATELDMEVVTPNGNVVQKIPIGRRDEGVSSVQLNTSALASGTYHVILRSATSVSMMNLVVER